MKAFNLVLTGLLLGIIVWLLVTLILGVIYQPEYSNDIKVTVNFNNKPVEGTETVETTRQVPVTCPFSGETKTSEVKTVVKTTKAEPSERRVVITEDAFKETMQKVAYEARREAQNEYDKNFSILLTILTIFGIAWPVIIALLQFKFNEQELDKINKAQTDAKDAHQKATEALGKNQGTLEIIQNLSSITKDAYSETLKHIGILFRTNKMVLSSMAQGNRDLSDYYYVLALRCAVWSIQAVKELGLSDDALGSIMSNVNLITPQITTYDLSKFSLEMLKEIKRDLQNNINVSGEKLELLVQIFTLLDEKIAAYEKLLAANNSQQK